MKIVVTGANGNIGAHIVRELLDRGHEVIAYGRQAESIHGPEVQYIQGDRRNADEYIRVMQALKPDAAFEMTCFTPEQAQASIQAFRGVTHFITASTVCTYGKRFVRMPIREEDEFTPWTDYGIQKHQADLVFQKAFREEQFPVTMMKPCTSYSEMSGALRSFATEHTWIDRVKRGKPILICGDGDILHQYMHTKDTARAFVSVLGKKHCLGQVYNVVQTGYTTWAEYHRTAMKVLGREVEMVGLPLRQMMELDPKRFILAYEIFGQHTYVSNEKLLRDAPEWKPEISLEEGLRMTFEGMERRGTIPDSTKVTWEDEIIEYIQRFRKGFSNLPKME
ncbi:NAD-dependent epimerase/dehydratase family protein [uncultured Ruthenibacterium sp.]|uniref:NAD-dependent epimerase/dehydratase family protein n=1 Tax=uncultured Ruthenibacterium sp. TaxID=1905347 RepID=UPI00349E9B1D